MSLGRRNLTGLLGRVHSVECRSRSTILGRDTYVLPFRIHNQGSDLWLDLIDQYSESPDSKSILEVGTIIALDLVSFFMALTSFDLALSLLHLILFPF